MHTISYKGFYIQPDKLLNFSLIDQKGNWCCSDSTVQDIKRSIDQIIIARVADKPHTLKLIH
jgi:hypothetical protein